MRKLCLLFVMITAIFTAHNAMAGCQLASCEGGADMGKGWGNLRTDGERAQSFSDGGQCYHCNWGDNDVECPEGSVVAIRSHKVGFENYIENLYRCQDGNGYDDDWVKADPTQPCTSLPSDDSQAIYLPTHFDSNKMRWMVYVKNFNFSDGDSAVITNSGSSCKLYLCKPGYVPSADKRDCIQKNSNCPLESGNASTGDRISAGGCNPRNPSTGLTSTEHVKSGNVCNLECVAGGWNVKLNDGACETDWIVDAATRKKCIEDPAVVAARQQRQQQQQQQVARNNQEKCQNSGGTWSGGRCTCDASKNLKKQGNECVCLDDVNYKRSLDGNSCELTDAAALERNCRAAAASGASWDGTQCVCSDVNKKVWNGTACVDNPDMLACLQIGDTAWNNGKCVCLDSNKEVNEAGTECVETAEARARREAEAAAARQRASETNINAISQKMDAISNAFGASVWKDKEGNFNTARLASDSIAGVVLGTAGGLITSNVVKKNQIKGGFEDLSCTIGGQVVASYGDDFSVGINTNAQ